MSDDQRPGASPGDRAIDAAWRRASAEEPSARANATILGAARTATRGRFAHWRPMAAAAAVAALALLLVPRTEREERVLTAPMQGPAAESAPPAVEAAPGAVQLPRQEAAAPSATAPAAKMQQATPQVPAPAVAREAPAVEAEPRVDAVAAGPATAQSRAITAAAVDAAAGSVGPQQWIDRIESLHATGDAASATAALQEFRRAYPDADSRLPPALQAWAASVPRAP